MWNFKSTVQRGARVLRPGLIISYQETPLQSGILSVSTARSIDEWLLDCLGPVHEGFVHEWNWWHWTVDGMPDVHQSKAGWL